jgi:hypothetical protein
MLPLLSCSVRCGCGCGMEGVLLQAAPGACYVLGLEWASVTPAAMGTACTCSCFGSLCWYRWGCWCARDLPTEDPLHQGTSTGASLAPRGVACRHLVELHRGTLRTLGQPQLCTHVGSSAAAVVVLHACLLRRRGYSQQTCGTCANASSTDRSRRALRCLLVAPGSQHAYC